MIQLLNVASVVAATFSGVIINHGLQLNSQSVHIAAWILHFFGLFLLVNALARLCVKQVDVLGQGVQQNRKPLLGWWLLVNESTLVIR